MNSKLSKLLTLTLILLCSNNLKSNGPVYYKEVNTKYDDYGASFRATPTDIELWITTNDNSLNKRSKQLKRFFYRNNSILSTDKYDFIKSEYFFHGTRNPQTDSNNILLDGMITFPYCDRYALFTSNIFDNGVDFENDIYEMKIDSIVQGISKLRTVNSTDWDDSPSISADGNFLYFASDRQTPGQGRTDIFMSKHDNNVWSNPIKLNFCDPNFSEQTPCISNDGYLYYSTNQTEDHSYDIWRVHVDNLTGLPDAKPEPLDWEGVNQPGSNESHPSFSIGGSWFLFSSNREENGTKDLDIYFIQLPIKKDDIEMEVKVQTRSFSEDINGYEDAVNPISTVVQITDVRTGKTIDYKSDKKGNLSISIDRYPGSLPTDDGRVRKFIITAVAPDTKFVAPIDTVIFDIYCNDKLKHVITLIDTAIYNNPECRQDFPVEKVQFFISAYWCPSTKHFMSYSPCASIFSNNDCLEINWTRPEKPCDNNDLYRYELIYSDPKIISNRQNGLCADMNEARTHGSLYAEKVDSAIFKFIDIMKSAMQNQCVIKALNKGKKVNVEVIGWTDPGGIDLKCLYTGRMIDFADSSDFLTYVKLKNLESKPYLRDNNFILANGTPFRNSRLKGNEMLSDLRAYYTAMLLDAVWRDSVDSYKTARQNGLINLIANGAGIDISKSSSKNKQRSVNVIVDVPITEGEQIASFKPDPGKVVDLSKNCGDSPCKPKGHDYHQIPSGTIITQPISTTTTIQKKVFPVSDGIKGNCWSILFGSFPSKDEAQRIKAQLESVEELNGLIEITEHKDRSEQIVYRVKTGCYRDNKTALGVLKQIVAIVKDLNLPKKPELKK